MSKQLVGKCPVCETPLAPIQFSEVTTLVVRRTCRNKFCHARWQVIARPKVVGNLMWIHVLDFMPVQGVGQ